MEGKKRRPDGWTEEDEREFKKDMAKVNKARRAIVDHLGAYVRGRSRDAQGFIPCPNCGTGELYFTRAAYNGHIHARCSTDFCTSWME